MMTYDDLALSIWQGLGHTFCRISLLDPVSRDLEVKAVCGPPSGRVTWQRQLQATRWKPSALPQQPAVLERGATALSTLSECLGFQLRSLLVIPIAQGGRVLGVLDIGERRTRTSFDEPFTRLATAMAEHIGLAAAAPTDETPRNARTMCELIGSNAFLSRLDEALMTLRPEADARSLHQAVARVACTLVDCERAVFLTHHRGQRTLALDAAHGRDVPEDLIEVELGRSGDLEELVNPDAPCRLLPSIALPRRSTAEPFVVKSALVVPIKRDGVVEHVLVLREPRHQPFGPLAEKMTERFASHAAQVLETSRHLRPDQRQVRPLEVLQKISDYVQSSRDEERIFHAILTGMTAGYGLGFNRAALFLCDEGDTLVGRLGIGHVDEAAQREAWDRGTHSSIDDFRRYLLELERGVPPKEPLHDRIFGLELPALADGPDLVSRAIREQRCLRQMPGEPQALPATLVAAFEPQDEVVVAPLIARHRVIGVVVCDNKFTRAQIRAADVESLILFATTAAIAVESRRKLAALIRASNTLISPDATDPLQELVDQTRHAAQASWVKLILVEPQAGEQPQLVRASSWDGGRTRTALFNIRPNGISREVMRTKQARPIEDVSKATDVNEVLAREGIRAALCLPWMLRNEALGVMWIHYRQPRPFPQQDIDDLQMYVNHIAAAWEDRQQMAKLKLTQRTFAEITTAMAGDSGTLESTIVQGTRKVVGCDTVTLYVRDADGVLQCAPAMAGVQDEAEARRRRTAEPTSFLYELIKTPDVYIAEDAASDPYFGTSRFRNTERIESVAAIPLRGHDAKTRGMLFVSYRRRHRFQDEELANLKLFAAHAAIAIQNAALFEARKRQVDQQKALLKLSEKLLASETPDTIMQSAAEEVRRLLRADLSCMALINDENDIVVTSTSNWPVEQRGLKLPKGANSHAGWVIETRGPVLVEDLDDANLPFRTPDIRKQHGTVSGIGVPMFHGEKIVGVMLAHTKKRRKFSDEDTEIMKLIASQAAIALMAARAADTSAKQDGRSAALRMAMETLQDSRRRPGILRDIVKNAVENLVARKAEPNMLGTLQVYDPSKRELRFDIFYPDTLKETAASSGLARLPIDVPPGQKAGITVRAFQTRRPQRIADVKHHKDYRPFSDKIRSELAVPLLDEGEALGVLNVESPHPNAFDEEDEKTLEALAHLTVLVMKDKKKEHYLGNMSHDFKRPISLIRNDVETLRNANTNNATVPPKEYREALNRLYNSVRQLGRIQGDVLSLAFIQQGASLLDPKPYSVLKLADRVATDLAWEARYREVALDPPSGWPGESVFDKTKVEQVLTNIVANAIKFSLPGGIISILIDHDPPFVVVSVTDRGIGIPPEHLEDHKIFRRFYRVDRDSNEGSGLGLAIAKDHVDRHGGSIEVESRVGEGSTFRVLLPLLQKVRGLP
jgi:GAF domain-containing protein